MLVRRRACRKEELLKNFKDKDGLFCLLIDKIDKELLDVARPKIKAIGTTSADVDHIDVKEVRSRVIKIGYNENIKRL